MKIKEKTASIAVVNMIKDGAPLLENYAKNARTATTLLKYLCPNKQSELTISKMKANATQVIKAYDGSEIPVVSKCIARLNPKGNADYPVQFFVVSIKSCPILGL